MLKRSIIHKIKKQKDLLSYLQQILLFSYAVVRFGDCRTCNTSSGSWRRKVTLLAVDYWAIH